MAAGRRWISKVALARAAVVAAVFVVLELLCGFGVIDRVTMISPSEMVLALYDILRSGRFNSDIAFTCYNTVSAIGLAVFTGFLLGAALHAVPRVRRMLDPLLSAYYAVPTF